MYLKTHTHAMSLFGVFNCYFFSLILASTTRQLLAHVKPELDMGRVHPWVGLGRFGSQISPSWAGRVVSGPASKMSNKYTIYTQATDWLLDDYNL